MCWHRLRLEDADILPRVQAERLWPVSVNSYPQLGTAGKRGNPGHKCRQSVLWAEIDILRGPQVVAADEVGRFCWYLCCLEQQSAASGVGVAAGEAISGGGEASGAAFGSDFFLHCCCATFR